MLVGRAHGVSNYCLAMATGEHAADDGDGHPVISFATHGATLAQTQTPDSTIPINAVPPISGTTNSPRYLRRPSWSAVSGSGVPPIVTIWSTHLSRSIFVERLSIPRPQIAPFRQVPSTRLSPRDHSVPATASLARIDREAEPGIESSRAKPLHYRPGFAQLRLVILVFSFLDLERQADAPTWFRE